MKYIKVRASDQAVIAKRSSSTPPVGDDWIEVPYFPTVAGDFRYVDGKFVKFVSITPNKLLNIRVSELDATDKLFVRDRPEPSSEWIEYRQALRDLTKDGKTVEAMLARFPKRPDGTDAIEHLRGSDNG